MATQITQPVPTQYPITRKLTLELEIGIGSEEDYGYFFDENGNVQLGFLADVYDSLDHINAHLIRINNKSFADIQRELQADI
jgi:hypothetical protein